MSQEVIDKRHEVDRALSRIITSYFWGMGDMHDDQLMLSSGVGFQLQYNDKVRVGSRGRRHNYEHYLLESNRDLYLNIRGYHIARLRKYPKKSVLILNCSPGARGYQAQKQLEKLLYYKFKELEVERSNHANK